MANIKEASNGSLAKNGKLNEVIRHLNGMLNMTVREGSDTESPRLISAENNSELVTTGGGDGGTFTLDVVKDDNTAGTATFNGPGVN